MDIRVAKYLVDAAEELGFEGWEVRENYHGRGFFKGAAVVYQNEDELLSTISLASMNFIQEKIEELNFEMRIMEFIDGLPSKYDNMGKGRICY